MQEIFNSKVLDNIVKYFHAKNLYSSHRNFDANVKYFTQRMHALQN